MMFRAGFFVGMMAALLPAALPAAEPVSVSFSSERLVKRVKSFKELRQQNTVLQELDYSCGAAALATVLTHHFRDPVGESEIICFIFVHGQTPEEGLKKYFRRQGFSLLDLKRFAEFRGYKVAGFKEMDLNDLAEFLWVERLPVLVPIEPMGYHHFVVLKGIRGNRVYYADPALGNMTMTLARFADIWLDGVGLVVSRTSLASVTNRILASEKELSEINVAGEGGRSTPVESSGGESSLLISPEGEGGLDTRRMTNALERPGAVHSTARIQQTFSSDQGPVFSTFNIPAYNGTVQFGDPPGNFIDFSPPRGVIDINQQ
jgi:predicted double-glycine peptidase